MSWQELQLNCTAEELPRVEALLQLSGAAALSVADAADTPLFEPVPGTMPVWPRLEVRALFKADQTLDSLLAMLAQPGQAGGELPRLRPVADADWVSAWRQGVAPLKIGDRFEVLPAEDAPAELDRHQLAIGMGLAFGTGQHPTTKLCLDWLVGRVQLSGSVLDYGCGSGILALTALKLGASQAWAVDIDPQALIATTTNAARNRLHDRVWVGAPAALRSRSPDLILANILAGTLAELAPSFARMQATAGRIVLSGILKSQADDVRSAYSRYYRDWQASMLEGWCLLTAVRREE
jgi:ribosomal protein L11 methyltransferase